MTMTISPSHSRRSAVAVLGLLLATTSMTACTANQRLAGVSLGGAALGAGIGKAVGGDGGMLVGALLGGVAGYFVAEHLNEEERKAYEASLRQGMSAQADNAGATIEWKNPDGTKTIQTNTTSVKPLNAAVQDFRAAGHTVNDRIFAKVPANTACRMAVSELRVNGEKKVEDPGLWCRTAEGDYVRVDGMDA